MVSGKLWRFQSRLSQLKVGRLLANKELTPRLSSSVFTAMRSAGPVTG